MKLLANWVCNIFWKVVFRGSSNIRISAQLIDGTSDAHLWVNDYEKTFVDLLRIQEELARDIATSLKIDLKLFSEEQVPEMLTANEQALEYYFHGMYQITRYTKEANEEAILHLKKALTLDTAFLAAQAGLAQAYFALH